MAGHTASILRRVPTRPRCSGARGFLGGRGGSAAVLGSGVHGRASPMALTALLTPTANTRQLRPVAWTSSALPQRQPHRRGPQRKACSGLSGSPHLGSGERAGGALGVETSLQRRPGPWHKGSSTGGDQSLLAAAPLQVQGSRASLGRGADGEWPSPWSSRLRAGLSAPCH